MRVAAVAAAIVTLTGCNCHAAVDAVWPASSRTWAHSVVDRESGGDAAAQNTSSTAAGCFQLLRMHAWRFDATGTSWAQRYDPVANVLAALNLYNEQGRGPWGG